MKQYTAEHDWLTVFQLSSCAPDLNPVEGLWSLLRRGPMADTAFTDSDHLTRTLCRGLRHIQLRPALIEECLAAPACHSLHRPRPEYLSNSLLLSASSRNTRRCPICGTFSMSNIHAVIIHHGNTDAKSTTAPDRFPPHASCFTWHSAPCQGEQPEVHSLRRRADPLFNRRKGSVLAVAAVTAALGLVPVGTAQAAACNWQQTAWELPAGTTKGSLSATDGGRYGVGITATRSTTWPYGYKDKRGTLWDNGKVVLRLPVDGPNVSDVNASGLIVGNTFTNNKSTAVTISRTGTTTTLPSNPAWGGARASVINNAGDIAGTAQVGTKNILVVWPASAPGTYRELPLPASVFLTPRDIDEQGRIIGTNDSGGFVTDLNGVWHTLATKGPNTDVTPWAIRDGRIVGGVINDTSYAAVEWNTQGSVVRTITDGALEGRAIGGNGTVGGIAYVGSTTHPVLWRDGVVSDSLSAVSNLFSIVAISADEKTLIGSDPDQPVQYTCS
ncbi:hypothetical protein ACFU7Y_30695 [Kitasatospora sp. NPDC057542]|uniref:hypothetical protein n=1 Tax=Kitasatospora sp. NPDC057542 TaxID=3346162 RepID=UPI00368FBDA9